MGLYNLKKPNDSNHTLDEIFDDYLKSPTLFLRRDVLDSSFVPNNLPHRTEHIKQLGYILASVLRGAKPSNVFCYGKTGTGKTAVSKNVLNFLEKKASDHGLKVEVAYLNCNTVDTSYRVFADLCNSVGIEVPVTGLATDEIISRFKQGLDQHESLCIVVLDEIDSLIRKSGKTQDTLYNLTRINTDLKRAKVSIIGISNDITFKDDIEDPRVISSLSEEEMVFKPYEAPEITDILVERAGIALRPDALDNGVINLIAAIAAQEHGDARRAIDLLRVSAEIAERDGDPKITLSHVKKAQGAIERNTITEIISTLPAQSKIVMTAIYLLEDSTKDPDTVSTGDVYEKYTQLCNQSGWDSLTQRRVGDLINELDALGIITARIVSRGRHGRTKEIHFSIPRSLVSTTLSDDKDVGTIFK